MAGRLPFFSYVKEAFKNRWNLLLAGGAGVAALLSGRADIFLPLVVAADLAALTFISANPRFQSLVEANLGAKKGGGDADLLKKHFDRLFQELDPGARDAFNELKARCAVMRDLARRYVDGKPVGTDEADEEQLKGINKLLWVYLKLLYSRSTMKRFLDSTDEAEIDDLLRETERRLAELPATPDPLDSMADRKRRSLEDTLKTAQARKENLKRARDSYDFVNIEIDRIAAKITGLAELAVNRQDPSILTHEVDTVARSVEATEQAIGEMHAFTGITLNDIMTPHILSVEEVEQPEVVRAR